MKTGFILFLCVSFLLQSCHSFYQISEDQKRNILRDPSATIQIILSDGTEFVAKPYHYVEVTDSSAFLLGTGELWNVRTDSKTEFRGKVQPTRVESIKVMEMRGETGKRRISCLDAWLSESTKVRFKESECVWVSSAGGPGLWMNGYDEKGSQEYSGKIELDQIKEIKQEKVSSTKTAGIVLVAVTCTTIFLFTVFPLKIDFTLR